MTSRQALQNVLKGMLHIEEDRPNQENVNKNKHH
jgi:hypothetical protein